MKIVVLTITQYKEKDAIIDAISENGDITFLARGVFDPKNKNSSINNLLSIAEIEINDDTYPLKELLRKGDDGDYLETDFAAIDDVVGKYLFVH